MSDAPLRSVYVEAMAGLVPTLGPFGRLEAGAHPWKSVSAFGYAQIDRTGTSAGLGARWEVDW